MAAITYIAKDRGELISGHSALTEYSFDVSLSGFNRSSTRVHDEHASLSGVRVTNYHRTDHTYAITTQQTTSVTNIEQMREFLTSVSAGEEFTLDPFGSVASPDSPKAVKIKGNYSEQMSQGGFVSFSFEVVQV